MLLCVVLCSMLAFAAEPTTSTEFDMHEGRAHWGVVSHHASPVDSVVPTGTGSAAVPVTIAAVAALLAVFSASPAARVLVAPSGPGSTVQRRGGRGRRGPPARA